MSKVQGRSRVQGPVQGPLEGLFIIRQPVSNGTGQRHPATRSRPASQIPASPHSCEPTLCRRSATMAKGPTKSKAKDRSPAAGKEDDLQFSSPLTAAHLGQDDAAKAKNKHKKKKKKKAPTTASDDEGGAHTLADRERVERKRIKDAKRARVERDRAEEARLTEEIFGSSRDFEGGDDVFSKIVSSRQGDHIDVNDTPAVLFQIDRAGADDNDEEKDDAGEMNGGRPAWEDSDEDGDDNQDNESAGEENDDDNEPKAAWVDEDDEDVAVSLMSSDRLRKLRKTLDETQELSGKDYQKRLRERYQKTAGAAVRTDWADVGALAAEEERKERASDYSDSDDDDCGPSASSILASTASLLSTSSKLPPNILKTIRCPDANLSDPNKSVVSSVQFHPGADPDAPLLLTAGLDKTLRFFRIDGDTNEKVHGIHFPNFPIYSASFLGDSGSVVVSSRRPHFYVYDAVAGKVDRVPNIPGRGERSLETMTTSPDGRLIAFVGNDGYIILVEAKSKLWVADLKMNGTARAVTFTPDGAYVIASGGDGEVYK